MLGLCVAYLDRTTLSVGLQAVTQDMGFAGDKFAVTASLGLTIFLIGYTHVECARRHSHAPLRSEAGGHLDLRAVVGGDGVRQLHELARRAVCHLILGVAEGVYWPQQSRFAKAWFAPDERTKANAII